MAFYRKNTQRTLSATAIVRSPEAKLTLHTLYDLAAEYGVDGVLTMNGEPLRAEQIVAFTGLTVKRQRLVLQELRSHDLIVVEGETLCVPGWIRDQASTTTRDVKAPRAGAAARQHRHRLRKNGLEEHDWDAIVQRQGGCCAICRQPSSRLSIDHIVPLAKGGTKSPDNIQALCRRCNSSKGVRVMVKSDDGTVTLSPFESKVTEFNRNAVTSSAPVSLETNNSTGLFSSSFVANATQDSALHAEKPPKVADTSWIEPLLQAVRPLRDRTFISLTSDERYLVAQYHCLKFGNCTKNESRNKSRASQVAIGLARFSRSKNFAEMTVGQYVSLAKKVWERSGKVPFFDPWLIEGGTEVRSA